jgi:hypothetical protein
VSLFFERVNHLPHHLADFRPDATVAAAGGWDTVSPSNADSLIAAGVAALDKAWPVLLASHYREYGENGNRSRFEALYFERRLMLNDLVLAEKVEGQGRFLGAIVDGIFLLCEESGWQLPAHNSYQRGGPRLPLPDAFDSVIDLFAAETAAILATTLSLLRAKLDGVDPAICRRIEQDIDRRIIQPYLSRHFWWMGNGDERMNNWTAWITQNVLIATFSLPTSQETRRAVLQKALKSLDAFLKDYAEDGACEEGVVYYRHAALCLFGAMTVLDTVAPKTFADLWREPKIRAMAEYIVHMHVDGDYYFNFADSSAVVAPCGAREYLFGKAVGSSALMNFAAADVHRSSDALMSKEWNLWYRVQAIASSAEIQAINPIVEPAPDIFYSGIGLFIARRGAYALAVKGGTNGESHNHNDVGSLTLYKNGTPLLIDVGVETYTAKTFSPRRYEIWTMQSAFHTLPSFGGVMQADGDGHGARDVKPEFVAGEARISMELAGAYPPAAKLRHYRRSVRLHPALGVELVDEYDGDLGAVLSLMMQVEPVIEAGCLILPGLAHIKLAGAGVPTVEAIDISDARLRQSWPERLYRVLVPFEARRLQIDIV